MKTVEVNCKVRLQFADEQVEYFVRSPKDLKIDLGEISTDSPLGKILLGKREGEELTLALGSGEEVWCRIVKIQIPALNISHNDIYQ
jgi:transcription elongation GreA/GreB family factor